MTTDTPTPEAAARDTIASGGSTKQALHAAQDAAPRGSIVSVSAVPGDAESVTVSVGD